MGKVCKEGPMKRDTEARNQIYILSSEIQDRSQPHSRPCDKSDSASKAKKQTKQ